MFDDKVSFLGGHFFHSSFKLAPKLNWATQTFGKLNVLSSLKNRFMRIYGLEIVGAMLYNVLILVW